MTLTTVSKTSPIKGVVHSMEMVSQDPPCFKMKTSTMLYKPDREVFFISAQNSHYPSLNGKIFVVVSIENETDMTVRLTDKIMQEELMQRGAMAYDCVCGLGNYTRVSAADSPFRVIRK